jgi:hypothetical protein
MMLFLVSGVTNAQDATPATETKATTESVFWVDSTANNAKLLNKSKFKDQWFLGLHAGTFFSWGSNTNDADVLSQFRPAAGLSFGKWLAPAGGFRLQALYGNNRGYISELSKGYSWHTASGSFDALINFSNIFCGYSETRLFNLIGVLGAGVDYTFGFDDKNWNEGEKYYKTNSTTSMTVRAGLMAQFRVHEAWDLNIEAVNTWIDDEYDGQVTNNTFDGHLNIFIGAIYRFKNHDGSRQFTYARRDATKYDVLNNMLDSLRAENKKPIEPEIIVKKETVKSNHIRTVISFEKKVSKINRLQEVNVYTAAQALSQIKDGDLYITINEKAANMDTDLFMQRAQSIRDMLVNNFEVAAGNIFIEKNPAFVNSLDPEKDCVILYVNE